MQSSSSSSSSTVVGKCCSCHRLSTFVLDISEAISGHVVTWLPVKSNAGLAVAPEETILYSLVRGRLEEWHAWPDQSFFTMMDLDF